MGEHALLCRYHQRYFLQMNANVHSGCFVRIAIGMDPQTKQQVYRIAQIMGTQLVRLSL